MVLVITKGSHRQYKHKTKKGLVTISGSKKIDSRFWGESFWTGRLGIIKEIKRE